MYKWLHKIKPLKLHILNDDIIRDITLTVIINVEHHISLITDITPQTGNQGLPYATATLTNLIHQQPVNSIGKLSERKIFSLQDTIKATRCQRQVLYNEPANNETINVQAKSTHQFPTLNLTLNLKKC